MFNEPELPGPDAIFKYAVSQYEKDGGSRQMTIGFKPLGDRVVVERTEEQEQVSAGGIIIPDTAKEKPTQGLIVSVGPGKRRDDGTIDALTVKSGDKVLYGKWGGNEIKIDGKEYLLMKEDDIYGIIE